MPILRYKKTGTETFSSRFNTYGLGEILTGDDSCIIAEMDVFLEATKEWKDMAQAFQDHDLINDNYNIYFFEPKNEEDRKRGFTL